ncbi:MAG: hypothetical protein O3C40_13390 [Planctomycetota bacterium]|nr:hypothetical protein [Planctomycetota bacterium]
MSERALRVQVVWRCVCALWQTTRRRIADQLCPAMRFVVVGTAALLVASTTNAAPRAGAALDQQARHEAINAIPFDQLTEETQAKLWNVVSQPTIYRQLPITVTGSDPDMHVFLVRYPEIIVNIWQLMGVTKVQIQRTGDYTFQASDGAGTVCDVQLVYGDENTHVYYAEGSYEGVLLRKLIRGSCVIVLKSDYSRTEDQDVYVTNQLDLFMQLDNVGAEILARTLHPLVGKSADHNFTESTRFLSQVSRAAETRSGGLQQLAGRLKNVDEPIRERFVQIATAANHRAALRDAGQQVWTDRIQAMPVTVTPVATAGPLMEGASQIFEAAPPRKPLRLRR